MAITIADYGVRRTRHGELAKNSEVLVSSWALAGSGDRIPISHGILDRALEEAVRHESCPPWVRKNLSFVDSRVGRQCIELPTLLDWAQRAQLTNAPSPACHAAQIQISATVARKLLEHLEITEEHANNWGNT